ncbi:MAG: hypothetical protein HON94_01040 [Methylococcales bacterium]|jgi:hypothetical protein|nr:hypothetical protein [Methylococcales bacterium]MBT7409469.1 hypothetical protein [Methylococcales bacterium]
MTQNLDPNFYTLQYHIELIFNGLIALLALIAINFQEHLTFISYGYLFLASIIEVIFGFPFSVINILTRLLKSLGLDKIKIDKKVPPKVVLLINSCMMGTLSFCGLVLYSYNIDYYWIPASLIAIFSLLAGTTGICPVAVTYHLVRQRKINTKECIPED